MAAPAALAALRRPGPGPARRVVVRWAWRMFRREWRRQALVLSLLTLAVAATTLGLAVGSNAAGPKDDPNLGSANTVIALPGNDPQLAADLAGLEARFGVADVVAHQSIPIPGSVATVDLRAEDPAGTYLKPTVRLDNGRLPAGPDQVAVTSAVAQEFGLRVGGTWHEGDHTWTVVGLVENPLDLNSQIALVAPGQADPPLNVTVLVDATQAQLRNLNTHGPANVDSRGAGGGTSPAVGVLVLATMGLLFVGLLAAAGFTVMAQRRMRSLGLLGSLGATDGQVRLVMLAHGAVVGVTSAVVGAVTGLVVWLALVSPLQSSTGRRIDRFALPWWAVGAAVGLAILTATAAAWWPARAAARVPVVAALSGRPPRPRPAHHFASAGVIVLAAGLGLLAFSHQRRPVLIVGGVVITVAGTLLLAPLAIRAVARGGRHAPVPVRMALRDLGRYQARSGAALGAVILAIGIATTIAVSATASEPPSTAGNLASNQLNVYLSQGGAGNPFPDLTPAQIAVSQSQVGQMAATLHASSVVELQEALPVASTAGPPPPGLDGQPPAILAKVTTTAHQTSITQVAGLYVATPALLAHYGINQADINPNADILTSQSGLNGLQIFSPLFDGPATTDPGHASAVPAGAGASGTGQTGGEPDRRQQFTESKDATNPVIQRLPQLPVYTSAPSVLITPHAMAALGLVSEPAGWMLQSSHPLTVGQVESARKAAAASGLYIETRPSQASEAKVRDYATLAGILLALGVLAATVGLIRAETGNDLRVLTANGAEPSVRRALTGATACALALEGAVLAIACSYMALIAWHRSNLRPLTNIPMTNLAELLVVLPVVALVAAWLLAGREPATISRRPLD